METEQQGLLDRFLRWLDDRMGIYGHTLRPAPRYAYRIDYWLGGFVLSAFLFELLTGPIVALYYTPDDPYASTVYLISKVPYGALLFSLHSWGAYVMIFLMLIHMTRNFVTGAYRPPREIMWMVGVLLAGLTLSQAYIGYSLPYNLISWVATTTGLNLFTYMPFHLGYLISLTTVVSPDQPGVAPGVPPLVQRFFVFHWILGGLIFALVMLHLYIFEKHGITPPISAVRPGDPELIDEYKERLKNDPNWELQPLIRSFGIVAMIFLLTVGLIFLISSAIPFDIVTVSGVPKYIMPEYNPVQAAQTPPVPDWYFLFVYFFYKSVTPSNASLIFLGWITITLLLPFIEEYIFKHKAPHPAMRPAAMALGIGFITCFIVNSVWAGLTPGRDIGPIGVEVDALIFALSFAIVWPLLRYVAQPRFLRKISESTTGVNTSISNIKILNTSMGMPQPRLIMRGFEVLVIDVFLLTGTVYLAYEAFVLASSTINQFLVGSYVGLVMIFLSILIYLNLVIRHGKR